MASLYHISKYCLIVVLLLFVSNTSKAQVGKSVKGQDTPISEKKSPFAIKPLKNKYGNPSLSNSFRVFTPKNRRNSRKMARSSSISYSGTRVPLNLTTLRLLFSRKGSAYNSPRRRSVFSSGGLFQAYRPSQRFSLEGYVHSGSSPFFNRSRKNRYRSPRLTSTFRVFTPNKQFRNVDIARSSSISFAASGVPLSKRSLKLIFAPKGSPYSLSHKRAVYSAGGLMTAYQPNKKFSIERLVHHSPFAFSSYRPSKHKSRSSGNFKVFTPNRKFRYSNIATSSSINYSPKGRPLSLNSLRTMFLPKGSSYATKSIGKNKRRVYSTGGLMTAYRPNSIFSLENFLHSAPFANSTYHSKSKRPNFSSGFKVFTPDKRFSLENFAISNLPFATASYKRKKKNINASTFRVYQPDKKFNIDNSKSSSISFAGTGIPLNISTLKTMFLPKGSSYSIMFQGKKHRKVYSSGGLFSAYQPNPNFSLDGLIANIAPFSGSRRNNKFANPALSSSFKIFSPNSKFRLENFILNGGSPFAVSSKRKKKKIRPSLFYMFQPDKKFALEGFALRSSPFAISYASKKKKNRPSLFYMYQTDKKFALEGLLLKGTGSPNFASYAYNRKSKKQKTSVFGIYKPDKKFSLESMALSSSPQYSPSGVPFSKLMFKTLFLPKGSSYALFSWGKSRRVWSNQGLFSASISDARFALENFAYGSSPFTPISYRVSRKKKKALPGFRAYMTDGKFALESFVFGGSSPFTPKPYRARKSKQYRPSSMGIYRANNKFALENFVFGGSSPFAGKTFLPGARKKFAPSSMGISRSNSKFALENFVLGGGSPFTPKAYRVKRKQNRISNMGIYRANSKFALENFVLGGVSPFTPKSFRVRKRKQNRISSMGIYRANSKFALENFVLGGVSPFTPKSFRVGKRKQNRISSMGIYRANSKFALENFVLGGGSPFTPKSFRVGKRKQKRISSMGIYRANSKFALENFVLGGASLFSVGLKRTSLKKAHKKSLFGRYVPDRKFSLEQFILAGGAPFAVKAVRMRAKARRTSRGFKRFYADDKFALENFVLGGSSPFVPRALRRIGIGSRKRPSNLSIFAPSNEFRLENFVFGGSSPFATKTSVFQALKRKISTFGRYSGVGLDLASITLEGGSPFTRKEPKKQKFKTTGTGFEEKGRQKHYDRKFALFKKKKRDDGLPYVMRVSENKMYSKRYVKRRDKKKEHIFGKKVRNHYKIK